MGNRLDFWNIREKITGEERPEERIQHYNEFHQPLPERERREQAQPLYGLRCSLLPGRYGFRWRYRWLPSEQPDSRME